MMIKEDLFAFSILVAGIIALIKFRNIEKLFLPFILFTWLAGLNELLSYWLMRYGYYTAVNNNIYVLAEGLLLITFLKNITGFEERPRLYKIYMVVLIMLWLVENILLGKITGISSVFRIACSVFLVLTAISLLSKTIPPGCLTCNLEDNRSPILLICLGIVVFFTFKLLVEIFWWYGLTHSKAFRVKLYDILIYINLFSNGMYAIALLWIRKKPQYITLY